MTGSGSTLFTLFDQIDDARSVAPMLATQWHWPAAETPASKSPDGEPVPGAARSAVAGVGDRRIRSLAIEIERQPHDPPV
jgi:hypothetical protein